MCVVILSPAHRPPFEPPQGPIAVSQSVNQACCMGGPGGPGGRAPRGSESLYNSLGPWAPKNSSQTGFVVGGPHALNQADRYQLHGALSIVIKRYQLT